MKNLKLKTRKSSFSPPKELKGKSNHKTYYLIERNGSIFERIFLNILDPTIRENLIMMHYMKNQVLTKYQDEIGLNVISRDAPWDFKVELSNSEIYNIEITSIAEGSERFEKFKREERFETKILEDKIPLHELEKLNSFFPNRRVEKLILKLKKSNVSKKELVDNPYKGSNPNLYFSSWHAQKPDLEIILREAIEKKLAKKHSEKDETVLIIDNRTMLYEIDDFFTSLKSLNKFIQVLPFKEIWIYTGYCSDFSGNNAEFSFLPVKISEDQWGTVENRMKDNPPNDNGVIFI